MQDLQSQPDKVVNNEPSRITRLFQRIRIFLVPPKSRRARMLRELVNLISIPFKEISGKSKKGQATNPDSEDVFDPSFYLRYYPDVLHAGVDPYEHYQQYGKLEGRLGFLPKLEQREGFQSFEASKDTVLVVSHEASRTGAPILSLNLVQNLQRKYNVVSLLLGPGSITEYFLDSSAIVVDSFQSRGNYVLADLVIEQLTSSYKLKFAIVNSIESRVVLPALTKRFIPTISLIHEFAAYTRPRGAFLDAVLWSHEIIFSTSITYQNAIAEYPELQGYPSHIIPQGLCVLPSKERDSTFDNTEEGSKVLNILRPAGLPASTMVILGIGSVHIRKGVDLFIECAARVVEMGHGKYCRFVWIGSGFDPENDMNYSIYLLEQIRRSGLQQYVFFMEETSNIEAAYQAADIILVSSRLDPLPNVAIDAMMRKIPLVCFDKTTGIADILAAHNLSEECVAPYLDTVKMAGKVIEFAHSKPLRERIGEQLRQVALQEFDMGNYISRIEQIGLTSSDRVIQEQNDVAEIVASKLARLDFFLQSNSYMAPNEAVHYYVRTWANDIRRRKLFPGFHPGIFAEQQSLHLSDGDPLAHYLRAGRPLGMWQYDIITSGEEAHPLPPGVRIALHMHVYYPDLLPEMLERLNENQVRPDLFVSVPNDSVRAEIRDLLSRAYSGKVIDVRVVPNCGRDIGPFLTAFGEAFVDKYDLVGHIHTKKTADVKHEKMGKDWYTFLLENLLGGQNNMADIILGHLATNPSVGIIFPDDPNIVDWGENRPYAEVFRNQLGLDILPENLLFPIGTMFWARVEALRPIFALGLDWGDYPPEPLPYDGSMLHALERLLPLVVSSKGFSSVLTNVTGVTR